ncbi:MAG: 3-methyl-2-oxobutanoate hydroxymethyltransferase [Bacteroidota bacterium]|nr:3-methyl-2-oxobutanoate hydroxymethyltransferase [Bacteroidota bacterium]
MITENIKRITTKVIVEMKKSGEKISALTAYDYIIAKMLDDAGIDIILVGDSLGNVFQGQETTLPVTVDEIIYHTKAVRRAVKRSLVVVDMPFLSYQISIEDAVRNCGRVLKETGAEAVKIESGKPMVKTIRRLVDIGIPVMGHLGLTPQSIHKFGSYEVRGKAKTEAENILKDAKELEKAGAFSIVLEKIPSGLAKKVTASVSIPTIGIGAGKHCDGQILVCYDMLGMFEDFQPKFARKYANLAKIIRNSFDNYLKDVKEGKFPNKEESF